MDIIDKTLELALQKGAEFVDMRLFKGKETRIYVENNSTKAGAAIIHDVNLRVFINGNWGVCSSNDLTLLPDIVENAIRMANRKKDNSFSLIEHPFSQEKVYINAKIRPDHVDVDEKLGYLHFLESKMKTQSIKKTILFYRDITGIKSVYNSEGAAIKEEVINTCLTATAVAKKGDRTESSTARKYTTGGYEHFKKVEDIPTLAVKRACNLLETKEIDHGRYNVVFDPALTGTLLHEILGHCAEADIVFQGNSVLKNKLGSSISSEDITVWDDPTIPFAPVQYYYDDEGVAARKKPIILNGVLTNYLHSLDSASKMRDACPGNGRCEDYSCSPLVRMSNTFIQDSSPAEATDGLFLEGTLGGEVEPGSGRFFIRPEIGELLENGTVKKRFKDIIVVGNILEMLQSVKGAGNEFYIDSGTCEKEGQTVLIGSGGIPLKISDAMIIGG